MPTLIHKIHDAAAAIGNKNGTKLAEPDPPKDIKSNSARDQWISEYQALGEHLVAATLAKAANDRLEKAKGKLGVVFGPALKDLKIGDSIAVQRGPITTTFNRRNGQRRINRQGVINVLSTAPYNWSLDKVEELLAKIEQAPPDGALYITPATTQE